jgi:stromal membrane-associated protein
MDSFIRSKYEACRWTLDGPPPSDPSILENGSRPSSPAPAPAPAAESNAGLQLDSPLQATRQAKQHRLLSVAIPAPASTPAVTRAPQPSSVPQPQPPKAPADDLLSLDFHAPPLDTTNLEPKKNPKQDILSLFSAPTSHTRAHFESRLSAASPQSSSWDQFSNQLQGQQQPPLTTSMMGGNGTAMWGASSGWNPAPVAAPAPGNLWANASSSNPWALSSATPTVSVAGADASSAQFVTKQKKDDAFTDLWK